MSTKRSSSTSKKPASKDKEKDKEKKKDKDGEKKKKEKKVKKETKEGTKSEKADGKTPTKSDTTTGGEKKKKKKKKKKEPGAEGSDGNAERGRKSEREESFEEDFEFEDEFEPEEPEAPPAADIAQVPSLPTEPPAPENTPQQPEKPIDPAMREFLNAVQAENSAAVQKTRQPTLPPRSSGIQLPTRKFIDPQRSAQIAAAMKRLQRGRELFDILELDVVSIELFDLPPLTEYKLYISNFGNRNAVQVYTQTGEDDQSQETQTTEYETNDRSVQFPEVSFSITDAKSMLGSHDSKRLASFLSSASQVCESLLEEGVTDSSQKKATFTSTYPFSVQYINVEPPRWLNHRPVMCVNFSVTQASMMVIGLGLPATGTPKVPSLKDKGIVCVWNLNDPTKPVKYLVCQSEPTNCCFSPYNSNIVIASTKAGTVCAWDLREYSFMHYTIDIPNSESVELRNPTYTTDFLFAENHGSSIVKMTPIVELRRLKSDDFLDEEDEYSDKGRNSFKLATLDEFGVVNIWVLVELSDEQVDIAGSESDYGLSIGGKVKLLKSATIKLSNPNRDVPEAGIRAFALEFHPEDSNQFFVSTDVGQIIHGVRSGKLESSPQVYLPKAGFFVGDVTSLCFCPHRPNYFVAGFSDGTINLYNVNNTNPIFSWETVNYQKVVRLEWSPARPSVFFAVSTHSIYVWDLSQNKNVPLIKEPFKANSTITSISMTQEKLGRRQPAISLGFLDGHVEVHLLSAKLTNKGPQEDQQLDDFLKSL